MKQKLRIIFVGIGALLTIVSAGLSHFILKKNNLVIEALAKERFTVENQIEQMWQNNLIFSLKKDFANILLPLAQLDSGLTLNSYAKNMLKNSDFGQVEQEKIGQMLEEAQSYQQTFETISTSIDTQKTLTIDIINDKYLAVLTINDRITALSIKNNAIAALALFFQIFGLIFVLSKDLFR